MGVEVQIHTFLTLALDRGEWSASRPAAFIPWQRTPGTRCIGGRVGPRAGSGDENKKPQLLQGIEP